MHIGLKFWLANSMLVLFIAPAMAFWDCDVPEITGAAGISSIAALAAIGVIAYQRSRKQVG